LKLARWLAGAATWTLLALQWAWRLSQPPSPWPAWLLALLFSLPLLPPAVAFLLRRPRAPLWAGTIALLYFCHGIAELRAAPDQVRWALAEIALSLAMVFAGSWPGLRARLLKRRAGPPPNV
jgi:uncharacterized membrane protein